MPNQIETGHLNTHAHGVVEQVRGRVGADKLLGGRISTTLRNEIGGMLALIPEEDAAVRAAETIYFVVTSPEYAYQR